MSSLSATGWTITAATGLDESGGESSSSSWIKNMELKWVRSMTAQTLKERLWYKLVTLELGLDLVPLTNLLSFSNLGCIDYFYDAFTSFFEAWNSQSSFIACKRVTTAHSSRFHDSDMRQNLWWLNYHFNMTHWVCSAYMRQCFGLTMSKRQSSCDAP